MAVLTFTLDGVNITKIKFNKYQKRVNKAVQKALGNGAFNIQADAKELCPVDTGRLRSSIQIDTSTDKLTWRVGTNVEYAAFVEFGTKRQKAQPYLIPAYLNQVKGIVNNLRNVIRNAGK